MSMNELTEKLGRDKDRSNSPDRQARMRLSLSLPLSIKEGQMSCREEKEMTAAGNWILQSNGYVEKKTTSMCLVVVVATIVLTSLFWASISRAETFVTETSYYTMASCLREGTSGITASGEVLNDEAFTGASWDFRFGQRLLVKCGDRQVILRINDRGPAKRLYKRGRRLDVSLACAKALGIVKKGIAQVEVEVIND